MFHIELMEMHTFSHCGETTVEAYELAKTCVLKTSSVKVTDVQFCLFIHNIHEIQAHLRTVTNFICFEELIEELNFFSVRIPGSTGRMIIDCSNIPRAQGPARSNPIKTFCLVKPQIF